VHKPNVFVPNDLDLIDESEATEIISQLLLRQVVVKTSYIDIPTRVALTDCQPDLSGDRRWFAPANFELLAVQRQFLDGRVCVKSGGSASVQEGQENTGFLWQHANGLQRAEVY
jgi:hypothetical protein